MTQLECDLSANDEFFLTIKTLLKLYTGKRMFERTKDDTALTHPWCAQQIHFGDGFIHALTRFNPAEIQKKADDEVRIVRDERDSLLAKVRALQDVLR